MKTSILTSPMLAIAAEDFEPASNNLYYVFYALAFAALLATIFFLWRMFASHRKLVELRKVNIATIIDPALLAEHKKQIEVVLPERRIASILWVVAGIIGFMTLMFLTTKSKTSYYDEWRARAEQDEYQDKQMAELTNTLGMVQAGASNASTTFRDAQSRILSAESNVTKKIDEFTAKMGDIDARMDARIEQKAAEFAARNGVTFQPPPSSVKTDGNTTITADPNSPPSFTGNLPKPPPGTAGSITYHVYYGTASGQPAAAAETVDHTARQGIDEIKASLNSLEEKLKSWAPPSQASPTNTPTPGNPQSSVAPPPQQNTGVAGFAGIDYNNPDLAFSQVTLGPRPDYTAPNLTILPVTSTKDHFSTAPKGINGTPGIGELWRLKNRITEKNETRLLSYAVMVRANAHTTQELTDLRTQTEAAIGRFDKMRWTHYGARDHKNAKFQQEFSIDVAKRLTESLQRELPGMNPVCIGGSYKALKRAG